MSEFVPVSEAIANTATASGPKRLYPIQNSTYYFFTGTNRDKNQVLFAAMTTRYVVLEFSPEGEYLHMTTEPIPPRKPFGMVDGVFIDVNDVDAEAMRVFQESISYTPGTIHVEKFWLEDEGVGIEDMPEYMIEISEDETEQDAIERKELTDEWIRDKCFVLWWGNDYWLNGDGEVESS